MGRSAYAPPPARRRAPSVFSGGVAAASRLGRHRGAPDGTDQRRAAGPSPRLLPADRPSHPHAYRHRSRTPLPAPAPRLRLPLRAPVALRVVDALDLSPGRPVDDPRAELGAPALRPR